ncbi:MAG TPA: TonB-dependent receptor [Candidatus Polarisedimenticolaceae bacterium]|nr:TonB-dependent receptor [Candidatus Polarisedimenticolaceae bacterium]
MTTPGSLTARLNDGQFRELPLRHTDVRTEITSFVARTTVEQVFANPFDRPIEAVYLFPLGHEAAVDDFELECNGRIVRGEIHPRDEAHRIYEEARVQGHSAALLDQQRPNVFLQRVANLMPSSVIRVRIRTVELLRYRYGVYEYLFPTVVGPRYTPGAGPDGEYASLEPERLGPGERSGHDIDIHVELHAGVPIADIVSPNHTVYVRQLSETTAGIDLAEISRIPNKDFVLRWDVSSEHPATALLTHRSAGEGFFTLLLQPRGQVEIEEAAPKEIVFVIDTSGSMDGTPIEMSKRFVTDALRTLGPNDRFNVVQFAGSSSVLFSDSVAGDSKSIGRAIEYIEQLRGHGGTELLGGLRKAVDTKPAAGQYRQIVFLTDGLIGNDDRVIGEVSKLPEQYRIFTVGLGESVNHHLLTRMAEVGHGASARIVAEADGWDALKEFREWVTRPYLTDIEIDWGGLPLGDLVPRQQRDLYSGQTLYLIGRYYGHARGEIVLRGYEGGSYWEQTVVVDLPEVDEANGVLASIWGRRRIGELMLAMQENGEEKTRWLVTDLAMRYRLMSPYTSFVAVDHSTVVNEDAGWVSVEQALPSIEVTRVETISGAETRERVVVTATSAVVDLSSAAMTTRFTDEFMRDLPVPGRFYQNVLTLAPGVQDAGGDGSPNVHGSRARSFRTVVDGIANVDLLTGQMMSQIQPNSIEEMEVIAAGAGVEFGRAQGGFTRILQTQGGNQFEGLVELGYRVPVGDGAGWNGSSRPGWQAGIQLSGPIVKNRLWYRLSHDGLDRDQPIDDTRSVTAVPTRASAHSDRITWQVSPRNKLTVDLAKERVSLDNVGLSSWIGPDSTRSVRSGGPRYVLSWIVPYSPKILVQASVAYQSSEFEVVPSRPGAANDCIASLAAEPDRTACLDLTAAVVSGPAHHEWEQDRSRLSVSGQSTIYAGRAIGATHQLELGFEVHDDRFDRTIVRGPTLIRGSDTDGSGRLTGRIADDPIGRDGARGTLWGVWAQDQLKPSQNLTLTLGLRADRYELEAVGYAPFDPNLPAEASARRAQNLLIAATNVSPALSVAWDPWMDGKSKFFLSAKRVHDELSPAVLLIEQEPLTRDVDLTRVTVDPERATGPQNVQIVDRDLEAPYLDEWTVGFERQIFTETSIRATLIAREYRDRLGFVDLNRTLLSPYWGEIVSIGNLHSARYRAFRLEWTRRQYRNWELQADYTYSVLEGDAQDLDLLVGDERSRFEVAPGYQAGDQRHFFRADATWITPWGIRLGGALRVGSGLPFSRVESSWRPVGETAVPVPRFVHPSGRRNDLRNPPTWTVDFRMARDFSAGRAVDIRVALEVFHLFGNDPYLVYNDARGSGQRIDGVDELTRFSRREVQLGVELRF